MKIIFLDIDGVLNSARTAIVNGGYPRNFSDRDMTMFDPVAIKFFQKLSKDNNDIKFVLSSTWRKDLGYQATAVALHLPIICQTPDLKHGVRGDEVKSW